MYNITHIVEVTQCFALWLNIEPRAYLVHLAESWEGPDGNSKGGKNWRATNVFMIDEIFVRVVMICLSIKYCIALHFSAQVDMSDINYIATYQRGQQAQYC